MMIYMVGETGAVSTNDAAMAAAMESVGYHRCTLVEYLTQMRKIEEDDNALADEENRPAAALVTRLP